MKKSFLLLATGSYGSTSQWSMYGISVEEAIEEAGSTLPKWESRGAFVSAVLLELTPVIRQVAVLRG